MSEQAPNLKPAQELYDAVGSAIDTGYPKVDTYGSRVEYTAGEQIDNQQHNAHIAYDYDHNMYTIKDQSILDLNDGKDGSAVVYKTVGNHTVNHETDDVIDSSRSRINGVVVNRAKKDPKTGKLEYGVVRMLTGKNGEKADSILQRRAARTLGNALIKQSQNNK